MKNLSYLLLLICQFSFAQTTVKKLKLIEQALAFEEKGDIENAIKTHEKVLSLDAGNFQSANSIAGLYGLLGKYGDEISWAEKAIKINRKYCLAYINLGNGYMLKGDLQNAITYYKKADVLEPKNPLPPYSLGVVEENIGNLNTAIAFYEQSVSRDASFENGYFNLAAAYANNKDFKNANKNILKVIALNPNDMDAKEMHKHILKELEKK